MSDQYVRIEKKVVTDTHSVVVHLRAIYLNDKGKETSFATEVTGRVENDIFGRRKDGVWESSLSVSSFNGDADDMRVKAKLVLLLADEIDKVVMSLKGKPAAERYYVESVDIDGLHVYKVIDQWREPNSAAEAVFSESEVVDVGTDDERTLSSYDRARSYAYYLTYGDTGRESKVTTLDPVKVLGEALAQRVMA